MNAAVPLVQHEREGPALALFLEQFPAEAIVVFLLRSDIENNVRNWKQGDQLVAVGNVVAIQVRRIDDDLLLQVRTIMRHEPAMAERRIKPVRLHGFVVINDRVARGWPSERRLGDGASGERIQE